MLFLIPNRPFSSSIKPKWPVFSLRYQRAGAIGGYHLTVGGMSKYVIEDGSAKGFLPLAMNRVIQ